MEEKREVLRFLGTRGKVISSNVFLSALVGVGEGWSRPTPPANTKTPGRRHSSSGDGQVWRANSQIVPLAASVANNGRALPLG